MSRKGGVIQIVSASQYTITLYEDHTGLSVTSYNEVDLDTKAASLFNLFEQQARRSVHDPRI